MSDGNAVPEVPAEVPATVVEQPAVETPAVVPVAADMDFASRIAALEPAARAVLKDVLTYISVGFNDYSLMIGVLRLAEMLK